MSNRVHHQELIDIDQNAMRILVLMVQHQRRTAFGSFEDGLRWYTKMIADHLRVDESAAMRALNHLQNAGKVERRGDEWFITLEGTESLQADIKSVGLNLGSWAREFRDEALSGMARSGARTTIENAALPYASPPPYATTNRTEDKAIAGCDRELAVANIAIAVGLPLDETRDGLNTGRVRRCNGTDPWHWGVFHAHGGKSGKKWQSLCIECRRKIRKSTTCALRNKGEK